MLSTILLALGLLASTPAPAPKASCELVGPRLDGTYAVICRGRVTEVRDSSGNVHEAPFGY